ncbi:hypothetical protein C2845_PM13G18230 [Panicum miliaceum]|uniref:Uncharacterized protein n=1 Tax=Panicum miliaceum TaxID=4540 RepID=A0A3L6RH22_PANMI|nr:hypothetical protein C2845_PM13G18230 [Panicum miliaceum]
MAGSGCVRACAGPPLLRRQRRLVVAERGMVAPRHPGKLHDLHRDRVRVGSAGERGLGEVRGDPAPGGAVHGARGDEQRAGADLLDCGGIPSPDLLDRGGQHTKSPVPRASLTS